jgi:hypothetical protein
VEQNTQLEIMFYPEEEEDWYFKENISNALNDSL